MGALVSACWKTSALEFVGDGLTCHLDNHRLGRFLDPVTSMYHTRQADQQGRGTRERAEW